jgi:hypothetical protein
MKGTQFIRFGAPETYQNVEEQADYPDNPETA